MGGGGVNVVLWVLVILMIYMGLSFSCFFFFFFKQNWNSAIWAVVSLSSTWPSHSDWSSGLLWGKLYGSPEISMYISTIHPASQSCIYRCCQMEEKGGCTWPGCSNLEELLVPGPVPCCQGSGSLWVCPGWARPWESSVGCPGRSPWLWWKISSLLCLHGLKPLHFCYLQKFRATHWAHSRFPQPL